MVCVSSRLKINWLRKDTHFSMTFRRWKLYSLSPSTRCTSYRTSKRVECIIKLTVIIGAAVDTIVTHSQQQYKYKWLENEWQYIDRTMKRMCSPVVALLMVMLLPGIGYLWCVECRFLGSSFFSSHINITVDKSSECFGRGWICPVEKCDPQSGLIVHCSLRDAFLTIFPISRASINVTVFGWRLPWHASVQWSNNYIIFMCSVLTWRPQESLIHSSIGLFIHAIEYWWIHWNAQSNVANLCTYNDEHTMQTVYDESLWGHIHVQSNRCKEDFIFSWKHRRKDKK